MRRWPGVAVSGILIAALLTGCGGPAGTDSDLTDDWGGLPPAQQFVPQTGVCHPLADRVGYLTSYAPMDCGKTHKAETLYVGQFPAEHANRPTPPAVDSAALRAVFPDCDARAQEFVGADWRGARLTVQVVPPSPAGWAGGSRWYRCDIFVLSAIDTAREYPADHNGSLRGALRQPSPLSYGCLDADRWGSLWPRACDQTHHFEYVGTWTAPLTSLAVLDDDPGRAHRSCRSVIARYVGVPDDGMMRYRTGTAYRTPSEEAWARGDRGVRCFLYFGDRVLTRSLKGGGAAALPIR
ncbi:septum formation family protein [Micromonospora sonneratiae]|uniref:Septum formation family protein n=1 Tax=Micromonospora sonneratiae TaxID=1184706 RepID=A0ABW3YEH4_9ACTN